MVSVASPGEVLPNAPDLGVASFARLGRIEVSHASSERPLVDPSLPSEVPGNEIGNVDASGEGGGRIFIRGGEFVADNAFVFADTRGDGEGQGIDIGITGQVTMRNGAGITADTLDSGNGGDLTVKAGSLMQERAFIGASTSGSGDGGQLLVEAGSLEMRNGASIAANIFFGSGSGGDLTVKADKMLLSGDFTWIVANALGDEGGDLGDITVTAGSLEVRNGAGIHAAPHLQGGDVTVTADRVLLSGDGKFLTGISSGGNIFGGGILGGGSAGDVTVTAGSLEVRNGAGISAQGNMSRSGNVTVTADRVFLSGDGNFEGTGITVNGSQFEGPAIDAGNVTIQAGSLEVLNGAQISASFSGNEGQGGNVTVEADRVFLSGDGANFEEVLLPTGIFAEAFGGSAGAGDVAVTAGNLEVLNGAVISTSTLGGGPGGNVTVEADRVFLSGDGASFAGSVIIGRIPLFTGIAALTEGPGRGGNVTVTAADITLQNGGSISAESTGTGLDLEANPDAGRSGTVFITATGNFRLFSGGRVSVETAQANAGDIILNVGTLLHLRDQSSITTSVAGGAGDGGNITIDPMFTVLDGGSKIVAQAREGSGGTILIDSDFFFKSPDSLVDASSGNPALSGTVEIDSPDTDITGGVTALPESFFDAATLLTTPCAERSGAEVSRLVIRRYEVLPDSPYALRVQLPQAVLGATDRAADERDIPSMRVHPSLAFTCPDHG